MSEFKLTFAPFPAVVHGYGRHKADMGDTIHRAHMVSDYFKITQLQLPSLLKRLTINQYSTDSIRDCTWFYKSFYRPSIPPNLHHRDLPACWEDLSGLHRHIDNRFGPHRNSTVYSYPGYLEQGNHK